MIALLFCSMSLLAADRGLEEKEEPVEKAEQLSGVGILTDEFLLHNGVYKDDKKAVASLLERKANPNYTEDGLYTYAEAPLFSVQSPEMIQLLLDAKANPGTRAIDGSSVLHFIVSYRKNSCNMLATLCQAGLDANLVHNNGRTPLLALAARKNSYNADTLHEYAVLYWYGGNPDRKDGNGAGLFDLLEESHPKKSYPRYAPEVRAIIKALSPQRDAACRSLVALAASKLNGATVLVDLVAGYSGLPGLKIPEDIEAWGGMIEEIKMQELRASAARCKARKARESDAHNTRRAGWFEGCSLQ